MRAMVARSFFALSALLSMPSCSLLGLDEFRTPACTSDTQCARRNARAGLDPAGCQAYRCLPNGDQRECILALRDDDGDTAQNAVCVAEAPFLTVVDCDDTNPDIYPNGLPTSDGGLRDGGSSTVDRELCDGLDNDCDTLIDEGVLALEDGVTWTPAGAAQHVRIAPEAGSLAAMTTGDDMADTATMLRAPYDTLGELSALAPLIPCSAAMGGGTCNVREVSVDALPVGTAMSFVSTNGCSAGRLHVRRWVGNIITLPTESSNIAAGIRPTGLADPCTRGGARHPVLSVLPDEGASEHLALVTWLGTEVSGVSPLSALVVRFSDSDILSLGDPAGLALGETSLDAAPIVLETTMHGWFVLALQGANVDITFVSDDGSPPLATPIALPAELRATALSATLLGDNRAALVLRGEDNRLQLFTLTMNLSRGSLRAELAAAPLRLDDGTSVPRSAPSVLHRATGFLDVTHATPMTSEGGLLVAYTEGASPDHLELVRVAERAGSLSVLTERTSLPIGPPNRAWEFMLYEGGTRARLLTLRAASTGATLHDAALCGPH